MTSTSGARRVSLISTGSVGEAEAEWLQAAHHRLGQGYLLRHPPAALTPATDGQATSTTPASAAASSSLRSRLHWRSLPAPVDPAAASRRPRRIRNGNSSPSPRPAPKARSARASKCVKKNRRSTQKNKGQGQRQASSQAAEVASDLPTTDTTTAIHRDQGDRPHDPPLCSTSSESSAALRCPASEWRLRYPALIRPSRAGGEPSMRQMGSLHFSSRTTDSDRSPLHRRRRPPVQERHRPSDFRSGTDGASVSFHDESESRAQRHRRQSAAGILRQPRRRSPLPLSKFRELRMNGV